MYRELGSQMFRILGKFVLCMYRELGRQMFRCIRDFHSVRTEDGKLGSHMFRILGKFIYLQGVRETDVLYIVQGIRRQMYRVLGRYVCTEN